MDTGGTWVTRPSPEIMEGSPEDNLGLEVASSPRVYGPEWSSLYLSPGEDPWINVTGRCMLRVPREEGTTFSALGIPRLFYLPLEG